MMKLVAQLCSALGKKIEEMNLHTSTTLSSFLCRQGVNQEISPTPISKVFLFFFPYNISQRE